MKAEIDSGLSQLPTVTDIEDASRTADEMVMAVKLLWRHSISRFASLQKNRHYLKYL